MFARAGQREAQVCSNTPSPTPVRGVAVAQPQYVTVDAKGIKELSFDSQRGVWTPALCRKVARYSSNNFEPPADRKSYKRRCQDPTSMAAGILSGIQPPARSTALRLIVLDPPCGSVSGPRHRATRIPSSRLGNPRQTRGGKGHRQPAPPGSVKRLLGISPRRVSLIDRPSLLRAEWNSNRCNWSTALKSRSIARVTGDVISIASLIILVTSRLTSRMAGQRITAVTA